MLADVGGAEGFGGFAGAGIFFAFGKIGELCRLLTVATAGETALERHTAAIGQLGVLTAAGQGGGGRTIRSRHTVRSATATAKQHLLQRLPSRLCAANSEVNGQYEGDVAHEMV